MIPALRLLFFFFFNDTATTEIYTLSLHDALPISPCIGRSSGPSDPQRRHGDETVRLQPVSDSSSAIFSGSFLDRKSTRLNSSHLVISYAVFCLKKKKLSSDTAAPNRSATTPTPAL